MDDIKLNDWVVKEITADPTLMSIRELLAIPNPGDVYLQFGDDEPFGRMTFEKFLTELFVSRTAGDWRFDKAPIIEESKRENGAIIHGQNSNGRHMFMTLSGENERTTRILIETFINPNSNFTVQDSKEILH